MSCDPWLGLLTVEILSHSGEGEGGGGGGGPSCCLPEKKTRNVTSDVTRSHARGRAQVVYYLSSAENHAAHLALLLAGRKLSRQLTRCAADCEREQMLGEIPRLPTFAVLFSTILLV